MASLLLYIQSQLSQLWDCSALGDFDDHLLMIIFYFDKVLSLLKYKAVGIQAFQGQG